MQNWKTAFNQLQTRPEPRRQGCGKEPAKVAIALPSSESIQARPRVETKSFIWRECFDEYEETLLNSEDRVSGLIGPQGFGKTVLLRYLVAKYIYSNEYLVIDMPNMTIEDNLAYAREQIRAAFYRTCALRKLEYEPIDPQSTLSETLRTMINYAEKKQLTLLIVIDQLRAGDDFCPLFNAINSGLWYSTRAHKVIVSSSTSRTSREVFGEYANHVRFQNFTTEAEAAALAVPGVEARALTGVSFLEAVRMTRPGAEKTIARSAMDYWTTYLGDSASASCKAEHMTVLHGVLSKESFDEDVVFSDAVDGDTFFWNVDGKSRVLLENRPGLAQSLLKKLKEEEQTYVEYLQSVVGSPFFSKLPRRTKGNILEDCFAAILREKRQKVIFQSTKLDGGTTTPNLLPITQDRVVINFNTTPSLDGIALQKDRVIITQLHDPDYAGVDFVVIHILDAERARLWFIQCTVQTPKSHGCKESNNFSDWIQAVQKHLTVAHKRLVFLTPNSGPHPELASVPTALTKAEVLHCNFTNTNVTGNHVLLTALKKPGVFE